MNILDGIKFVTSEHIPPDTLLLINTDYRVCEKCGKARPRREFAVVNGMTGKECSMCALSEINS